MTQQEEQVVLEKVIRKAQANGFADFPVTASEGNADIFAAAVLEMIESGKVDSLIFNHNFISALWPPVYPLFSNCVYCGIDEGMGYRHQTICPYAGSYPVPIQVWHLQRLALLWNEGERVQYLAAHIGD